MSLHINVWLDIEAVGPVGRARTPYPNSRGLEGGWRSREQMRETKKSGSLEVGEPGEGGHGNQGKRRF